MAVRLLVVEDSTTQRAALSRLLQEDGEITVVAAVGDADAAVDAVLTHGPDVVTMDLDVPGGGGLSAIRRIMAERPTPILVVSALIDGAGAAPAIEALASGAVDAVPKPQVWAGVYAAELRRAVRRVAGVPVVRRGAPRPVRPGRPVVGVGASTGGPAALALLLGGLGDLPAPVLVVQHIHASFAPALADYLARETGLPARLARNGDAAAPGAVLVAPGDAHLTLDAGRAVRLRHEPADALHRPSADVLLQSIADHAGTDGIGVLLTGMGRDGARGLLAMRGVGATTLAQDAASSVVYGMPKAALEIGAVHAQGPPAALAATIREAVAERMA